MSHRKFGYVHGLPQERPMLHGLPVVIGRSDHRFISRQIAWLGGSMDHVQPCFGFCTWIKKKAAPVFSSSFSIRNLPNMAEETSIMGPTQKNIWRSFGLLGINVDDPIHAEAKA